MAYNVNDVTAAHGDVLRGPIWGFPGGLTGEDITFDFDPAAEGGIRLGESSTDGVDSEQTADENEKNVWGKSLGRTYSNKQDTLVVRLASALDPDVLGTVFGTSNVVPVTGGLRVDVTNDQPQLIGLLIQATSDDGRAIWIVVPQTRIDPNISRSFTQDDIIVIEATFNNLQVGKRFHYELIETADDVDNGDDTGGDNDDPEAQGFNY